jgi:hypothetical protein
MLDAATLAHKRKKLAGMMSVSKGELDNLLKAERAGTKDADEGDEELEEVPTMGGMIEDHFVELMFDTSQRRFVFAVRSPDGRIGRALHLDLNGKRYTPSVSVNLENLCASNTIVFASSLGLVNGEEPTMQYLHERICKFSYRYLDVDETHRKIAAYYVIFTWVFDCFEDIGFLRTQGPYGSGKTRYVTTLGSLCYRAIFMAGITTFAALFRVVSLVKGTMVMDELNAVNKQIPPEFEMIFNLASSRRSPAIVRMTDSGKELFPEGFKVFNPAVFGAIKDFVTQATNSRCITFRISETARDDIPESLEEDFSREAAEIRNLLMTFRMRHWQPTIQVKRDRVDKTINRRLRQISSALVTLIDDEKVRAAFVNTMRDYDAEMRKDQEMTITAKVVWALDSILKEEPSAHNNKGQPQWDTRFTRIAEMVKKMIFDEMDAAPIWKVNEKGEPLVDANGNNILDTQSPRNKTDFWVNKSITWSKVREVVKMDLHLPYDNLKWHPSKANGVLFGAPELERMEMLRNRYGTIEHFDAATNKNPPVTPSLLAAAAADDDDVPQMPDFGDKELG